MGRTRISGLIAVVAAVAVGGTAWPLGAGQVKIFKTDYTMTTLPAGGQVPVDGPLVQVDFDSAARRYVTVSPPKPFIFQSHLEGTCDAGFHIEGADLTIAGTDEFHPLAGHPRSFGTGVKAWVITTSTTFAAPDASPGPATLCNQELDRLLARNDYATAQKGFVVHRVNAYTARVGLKCVKPGGKSGGFSTPPQIAVENSSTDLDVWVHCMPAAVAQTHAGAGPPTVSAGVKAVDIWVNPKPGAGGRYVGQCPVHLSFGAQVSYVGTGDVRYRWVTSDGATSPVYTTAFGRPDTHDLHFFQHAFGHQAPHVALAAGPADSSGPAHHWVALEIEHPHPDDPNLARRTLSFDVSCVEPTPTRVAVGGLAAQPTTAPPHPGLIAPPSPKPDLTIRTVGPLSARSTQVSFEVANRGAAASVPTQLRVALESHGKSALRSAKVQALPAGGSTWVEVGLGVALGAVDHATAHVDDPNVNVESNEGNNAWTVK